MRPLSPDRLDPDAVLADGGTITLTYDPGTDGELGPDGEVVVEPRPATVTAVAYNAVGSLLAEGEGPTVAEALAGLGPVTVSEADDPW